jgi:undecaprenyl-diphosphatase
MTEPAHIISVFPIDVEIVWALNSWMGTFPHFDRLLHFLNGSVLVKGVPFMTALWWLGARDPRDPQEKRDFLLRALLGLLVALVAARWLQNFGPYHPRPIGDASLGLTPFTANDPNFFVKLNSFPSDHAVEFFAMSLAIATRRLKLGYVAFAWTFLLICLPRVYFGYHYPTDILAGALLGVAVMAAALWIPTPTWASERIQRLCRNYYGVQQAAMFVVSMELAVNFDHIRETLSGLGLTSA